MVRSGFLAIILLVVSPLVAQVYDPLQELDSPAAADSVAFIDSLTASQDFEQDWEYLYPEQVEIPVVEKEEVLLWIDQKRAAEMRDELLWYSRDNLPVQYRFGSGVLQGHFDPYALKIHGFTRPQTMMDQGLYLDYLSRYHHFTYTPGELNGEHLPYTLPVTVSALYGSLGDYDSRDVSFLGGKGDVFGIKGSALYLDYTMQNGYWLDLPKSGSSIRPYLSYRYGDFDWAFEYASYSKNAASLEMLPYYWTPSSYRIKHKYSHVYSHLRHPLLQLSILSSRDSESSGSFDQKRSSKALQVAAESSVAHGINQYRLRYEYADIERDYSHAFTYNQEDYDHLLELSAENHYLLDATLQTSLADWERISSYASIGKSLYKLDMGLYDRRYHADREPDYMVQNPADGTLMSGLSIFSDFETGVYASWRERFLQINASVAYQNITQTSSLHDLKDDQALLRLYAGFTPRFGDWELSLHPGWTIRDYNQHLMENPQYTFSTSASLTRHLGYDNALQGGFRLLGHSHYYLANAGNPALVEASTILDLWLLLKVGRLFDITVSAQNVIDSSIMGVYPIPPSLHVRLRWFFLN